MRKFLPSLVLILFLGLGTCFQAHSQCVATDVTQPSNLVVCPGSSTSVLNFSSSVSGTTFHWENSNTAIGLPVSGNGSLPTFMATNAGSSSLSSIITVTPFKGTTPYAYVANYYSNSISVINVSSGSVIKTITGVDHPYEIAVSPDRLHLYVSAQASGSIKVINTFDNTVSKVINVGGALVKIAISPDGKRLYVLDFLSSQVSVIHTDDYTVDPVKISAGSDTQSMELSPDGSRLYVVNKSANKILVFNTNDYSYTSITLTTKDPLSLIFSPDGSKMYIRHSGVSSTTVIRTSDNTEIGKMPVALLSMRVSADGTKLYGIKSLSPSGTALSVSSTTAPYPELAAISIGDYANSVALAPDASKIYVSIGNSFSTPDDVVQVFNASNYSSAGTITVGATPINIVAANIPCASTPKSFTVTVNPATQITGQPSSQSKKIGDNVDFSVVASGTNLHYQWKKEGSNVGTDASTFNLTGVNAADAGTYSVVVTGDCGVVTSGTATLTIIKNTPDLTFQSSVSRIYGAEDFAAGATSNSTGVISYTVDKSDIATVNADGTIHIKNAGTVTITATQAETADYSSATANQTLTINKAPLTITADNKVKLEGMVNPELTASYTGFVRGESQSVLSSLPVLSTTASSRSYAGKYDIEVKNAAADNYDITYVKGTLTVNSVGNNLKVAATSETCKTSNNGEINITATQPLTYTAVISSNSTTNSYSFTTAKKIENLSAGTYNVCVTAAELEGFEQCYNIEVTEPKDLSAYARVNKDQKTIIVDLSGAQRYWIELNGKTYTTTESQITLPAVSANNSLKVTTDKPCQGVIERNINLSGDVLVYPNPFTDKVHIDLGNAATSKVQVEVSDLLGKNVYNATLVNNSNIEIDLSSLTPGVYMMKVTAGNSVSTHKIIKK